MSSGAGPVPQLSPRHLSPRGSARSGRSGRSGPFQGSIDAAPSQSSGNELRVEVERLRHVLLQERQRTQRRKDDLRSEVTLLRREVEDRARAGGGSSARGGAERRAADESSAEAERLRGIIAAQEEELRKGRAGIRGAAARSQDERELLLDEAATLQDLSDEQERELSVMHEQLKLKRGGDIDARKEAEQELREMQHRVLDQKEQREALARAIDDSERGLLRDTDRLQLELESSRVEAKGKESDLKYSSAAHDAKRAEHDRRRQRVLDELDTLRRSTATVQGDIESAKATLQRQSQELGGAATALEKAGVAKDEAASSTRTELAAVEAKIREMGREHDDRCRQKERLGRAAVATAEELGKLERQAEELQSVEMDCERQLDEIRDEAASAASAATSVAMRCAAAEAESQRFEPSHEETLLRTAIKEATEQTERLSKEHEEELQSLEEDVDNNRDAIASLRDDQAKHGALLQAAQDGARVARRRELAARRASARAAEVHKALLESLRDEEELLHKLCDEYAAACAPPADGDARLRAINHMRALADDKNRELMRKGRDLIDLRRKLSRSHGALSHARAEADGDAEEAREREELLRLHAALLQQKDADIRRLEQDADDAARLERQFADQFEELQEDATAVALQRDLIAAREEENAGLAEHAAAQQERADSLLQQHWRHQRSLAEIEATAAAERTRTEVHAAQNPLPISDSAHHAGDRAGRGPSPRGRGPRPAPAAGVGYDAPIDPIERRLLERRLGDPMGRYGAGDDVRRPVPEPSTDVLQEGWSSLAAARERRRREAERAAQAVAAANDRAPYVPHEHDEASPRRRRPPSAADQMLREAEEDGDLRLTTLKKQLAAVREQNLRRAGGMGPKADDDEADS